MRERMYSSYSFTTSAIDGGERSASRPGRALLQEKGPPVLIDYYCIVFNYVPVPYGSTVLEEPI
jgi:hypothetical protein